MTEPLLKVEGLYKEFPERSSKEVVSAATNVNFHVSRGETLGLIGESGSGKTTVGRCILGLIEPTQGKIYFEGKDITELSRGELKEIAPRMQMVFQDPYTSLDPRMSIGDSVKEPLRVLGFNREEKTIRAEKVIDLVSLNRDILPKYPHQISDAEKQRVGMARALVTEPSFIVLDEPISNLDLTVRAQMLNLLSDIQEETGVAYLYISHDLTTVKHICDRVAVMYLSKIMEVGTKEQVFETPQHPYSRALLSSSLSVDPRSEDSPVKLKGEIPSAIQLPSGCVFHTRCPVAEFPICREGDPALREIEGGQVAACHFAPLEEHDKGDME